MKRLVKKASVEYKLVGQVHFTAYNNFENDQYDADYIGNEYVSELKDKLNDEMSELGPKGLADYIDYDYEKLENELIQSIIVSAESRGDDVYSITTIKSSRELSDDEKEKVKKYISGQFSDGFGEGFEQRPIAEWTEDYEMQEDSYEDEETGDWVDGETYTEDATCELFAHLWTPKTKYNFE